MNSLPRTIEEGLLAAESIDFVIGVDEAGRGPLAGPVVAGACVYLGKAIIPGVTDSKQISEEDREIVYDSLVKTKDLIWSTAAVDHKRIDEINILQATFEAMTMAVHAVVEEAEKLFGRDVKFHILIDGNKVPPQLKCFNCTAVVKGDAREFIIAAASVFAKVDRDKMMIELDKQFPVYGFKQHKGYPTGDHRSAIHSHGPCPYHRMTFAPLKHMKQASRVLINAKKGKRKAKPFSDEGSILVSAKDGQVRRSARLCVRDG